MTDGWRLMMQGEFRRDGWGFAHRYRLPTAADLVAALIAEGGEIRETHLSHRTPGGEVERAVTAPVHGRYLIFRIPAEETTT